MCGSNVFVLLFNALLPWRGDIPFLPLRSLSVGPLASQEISVGPQITGPLTDVSFYYSNRRFIVGPFLGQALSPPILHYMSLLSPSLGLLCAVSSSSLGTRPSLIGFEDDVEQFPPPLWGRALPSLQTLGPSGHTNSPHPSSPRGTNQFSTALGLECPSYGV